MSSVAIRYVFFSSSLLLTVSGMSSAGFRALACQTVVCHFSGHSFKFSNFISIAYYRMLAVGSN